MKETLVPYFISLFPLAFIGIGLFWVISAIVTGKIYRWTGLPFRDRQIFSGFTFKQSQIAFVSYIINGISYIGFGSGILLLILFDVPKPSLGITQENLIFVKYCFLLLACSGASLSFIGRFICAIWDTIKQFKAGETKIKYVQLILHCFFYISVVLCLLGVIKANLSIGKPFIP